MHTPIIIGIIFGILTCLFIKTPKTFIEPYLLFGMVYFLVVFIYISLKVGHITFITKHPLKYFTETIIIGLITYLYFYLVYHFRGLSITKDHPYFIFFTVFVIIVHTLLEVVGIYHR